MRPILLATAFAAAVAGAAPALAPPALAHEPEQLTCRTDRIGVTACLDGRGNTYRGKADPHGRLVWRDGRGRVVSGYTDAQGRSVFLGPDGARIMGYEDGSGNSAWRMPDGRTVYGHSDPATGNSVYRDRRGNVLRCHYDGQGHEICLSGREDH